MSVNSIYVVNLAIYLLECNRITSEPGAQRADELKMPVESARKVLAMGRQACTTQEQLKEWFMKKIEEIKKEYIGPNFYLIWLERFREETSNYLDENVEKVVEGNDFAKIQALLQKLPSELGDADVEAIKAVRNIIRVQVFQRQIVTFAKQGSSASTVQAQAKTPEQTQTQAKSPEQAKTQEQTQAQALSQSPSEAAASVPPTPKVEKAEAEDPWPHEEYLYFALHTLIAIINATVLSEMEQGKIKLTGVL
jgi:hypothetical protein